MNDAGEGMTMSQNDVELIYELSPMQEAMLFASLYAPGSGVYVVQLSLRLSGRLDVAAFERAWRLVVERHGVLRTGFYWEDLEKPMQVVYRQAGLEIRRESLRGLSEEEQDARLQEWLDADRETGFDLGEPPLVRLALFDLGAENGTGSWRFVWSQHHLVLDGWSQGLLLKELFTCYADLVNGREPPAAGTGRAGSYRDYIAWLQRQDLAAAESFWRQALAGFTAPTLLAGGDGRPAARAGFRSSRRRQVSLPEEATAALRDAGRRHALTLNTLVQGAWSLLVAQATGEAEVVFGSTVAGRPAELPGVESIVGLFINTLPVRVAVPPERGVLEWLRDLQERQVEARRYEHAPLHAVQGWSEVPAGVALFDNLLVFESYPVDGALAGLLPDLTLSPVTTNELTNYPLTLVVIPGTELSLEIVYDSARFTEGAAGRILERLTRLLQAFAGDLAAAPERRLADLPLMLPAEREELAEWNDTAVAWPGDGDAPVHALVREQAARTPERIALVCEGQTMTYGELAARSRSLAGRLLSLGAGPEVPVGVCLERSLDLMVALYAVLEAGAAWLPLDPDQPAERRAAMIVDSGASLVISGAADLLGQGSQAAVPPELSAGSLAYVLFTSGSTGRPKGAMNTHGALRNRLLWMQAAYPLTADDRVLQKTPIGFDVSVWELIWPLMVGARLVLARPGGQDSGYLADVIEAEGITTLHFVPSLLRVFLDGLAPGRCRSVRRVIASGEALPADLRDRFFAKLEAELHNLYGPTEAAIDVTAWECRPGDPRPSVPIGRPIANTEIRILDTGSRPVPAEVAGELCIGGAGLARGYAGRPDLTAERFIPDAWSGRPGARLYRTGDLARWQADGVLEYLGRLDQQVKIRGVRIEPGEIEEALARHPEVAQAVVAAREDGGEKHLVAWVVPRPGSQPAPSALSAFLQERLPAAMIPTAWAVVAGLPRMASGKVDRKALPEPESASGPGSVAGDPGDPITELLAWIWADVLGRERVGIHDDFFVLGGHSLLATRMVSRIRSVLGAEIPVRRVLEEPTVARLAAALRKNQDDGLAAPPLEPVPREGDLPLSFAQQRLWFIDQLQPGNPGYNIATAARLTGDLAVPKLARVFAEVVRRHEVLRTTFASREGRPVQVIAPEPTPALPVVDLAGLPPAAREPLARRLAVEESLWPFDLQKGPLLHLTLVRLGEAEHLLLVTMHHIVSDGWSIGVLMREVQALYRGLSLPELPVQYADYAVWQRQWLAGEALERQLAWWRGQLAGTPGVLELTADRPRPPVFSLRGGETRFAVEPALLERLLELGRREGATLYMVLAAALFALLARLSGQKDLTLGSPIAGRTRLETEGLIGFFVNTLVLRADVGRAEVFLDLLRQVREASLGAYAHQDLPFEKLVDEIQPERDLSRSPLVQVALAVNNLALPGGDLEGLVLVPEDAPAQVAKFDLAFILGDDREGRFAGLLHYATDLYDATSAIRLTRQFTRFLDELAAWPEQPLEDLSYLTAEERQQVLLEWNDTAAVVRPPALLHQLFAAQAAAQPAAPAVVWEGQRWTYAELASRARGLAHLLVRLGTGRGTPVGVWMERSPHMVAAVLGILEAGGTYVPLDPSWPAERVETILAGMEAPVLVASRATLPAVEAMQWRLPWLGDAVCLDVAAPEVEPEALDTESVRALWDLVAERATDRVTAGGFVSSFTGLPFLDEEVDEYRDRVLSLAAPWLQSSARVLEVGSGAGLILWEMARRVARVTGVDPSALVQERNRAYAESTGIGNVDLQVGFAHEIGELFATGSFDLIVLASTAQFFPGPQYLERVVATALGLLAPGGALLVADVPDARREAAFRESLAAAGAPPKQGARELWLDEDLFRDLGGEVLHRVSQTSGFANELGYRYDVLLRQETSATEPRARRKRLWTGWHAERLTGEPPLPAVASPEDVAYIIHTSGSTGVPKGIAVQHAPAVNLVEWVNRSFGVGPEDRLLFVTSLCFDLSVYDIFGLLAAGGTVHVAPEAALRDPAWQVRLLREEPVTIWDSAPAALQQLAPLFPGTLPASALRLVLLSGDWIPVRLPDQVRAAFPRARVVALGGATEATVWSNWFPVEEVDPRWPSIPYGRPITEARYHVLDEGMQPCPIGIPGDLYIGGRCLCVGYAGQAGLTAAQFVPDPFAPAEEPGARLYRTGDRSRFFADGTLEFLGRVDQQVKVRGYRIELGEIEVALLRHPGVRETVVIVREDRPGDRLLAAYVVPREGAAASAVSAQALRAFLWDRLPSYMVPSAFVTLAALPVTDNGKLDRKALPAPERGRAGVPAVASETAADPVEELLADLFAEVLGLDHVGVRESFFTLGGHSLLATQLMSRVRATLKVEVPLHALFEAPTVAELARAVWTARQEGSALAPPLVPLPPERRQEDLPLSFAQQRLWLIDQLEPGNAAYNIPFAVRLAGEISADLLARIFAEVIRRHETLRTTFAVRGERPVQVIAPVDASSLPEIVYTDLADRPEAEREALARELALAEARRPFDLQRGPLLRLGLVRLEERRHLLLVTMHHIISDGWSMSVLLREVGSLHAALAQGLPASLPELPVQYADFAVWQRDWLQGGALAAQLDFWKRRLADAPTVLELPTDHPRPAAQTFSGALLPVALEPALAERLRELCRERGVTPFMALLAAWSVLLGRHAAQEDVLVGTPVAGRNRRETEDLIGFFINTLVMRADLTGAPSFGVLLERIRDMALDAFAHQDVPFERLVEELVPERDLAVPPLFQVLFVLQNAPGRPLTVPGLVFSPLTVDSGLAKFDLTLTLWEAPEGVLGTLERNTDLFDGATAERLLARFAALLAGAVADPGRALPDLPLLLPAELDQVLRAHNDTATAYPRESAVPELFEEVARRYPDEPAVVGENGEVWTYRRLDEAANRLARHLRQMGVRVETAVCISMERSPELILGTLAILKAGGVYVPMDPVYPAERLVFMLADTGAEIVLVHERTRDRLAGHGARLVTVDPGDAVDLEGKDAGPLGIRVPAESPAYVIYTSGSTGLPKGVEVPHRGIARLARETNFVHLGPGDRTGQVVSISFDVATYEIWCALLTGAAVVVIPREVVLSSVDFAMLLLEQGVTSMFLTSSLFTKMAAEVPEAFGHMTELLVGGEAVDPAAARTVLLSGNPPRRLLNGYGPTESTTFAAWHWIQEVAEGAASVPIGLPLSNTTLYVLDRWQAPVPPGSVGELCIGGDGLAQGYRNRPDLTAERFVPNPFGDAGERLYRTGDLTRHTPEGVIDYLGRLDDQVKIRGFRIEPGEVEAVLSGNPAVKECAVIARTDGRTAPGARKETRLVAYVVGQEDQPPRLEDLRSWIEDRLPDYMMPSAFVLLPALPLTANGKVDRKALPAPERAVTGASEGFTVADPMEELLAGILAEVLALPRVGPHDDFFALGGHSLLATQVVSRIRQVFGVELVLRQFFEAPTVAQLSRVVREARAEGLVQVPPIVPVPRQGDLPLSFAQQRLWFLDQLDPENAAYNLPAAMRLSGEISVDLLERVFTEVVRRHEVLRTTFSSLDGKPAQVIAPPAARVALPVIDLSSLPAAAREPLALALALEEARYPFDLERGPMLRLALVRLESLDHLLLMTMHHVASDGWSQGVLMREIGILHDAFSQDLPSPLPELPVQYADFAVCQRSWLQGDVLEAQIAYWKRQLAEAPRVLDLPTDRPRPASQTFRGAIRPVAFPAAMLEAVHSLCRREGVTSFMVLLAAWSVLLGRHAGQDDVLVGTPVAGRNRREIEDLIGFFVNTLVLRADLAGAPSFTELLGRVRGAALDAFAHQDLPFERVVEELVTERDLSRSPLIQAVFAQQNVFGSAPKMPGVAISQLVLDSGVAKFDLLLALYEIPDGLAGSLQHNTHLFDGSTAERLLARFAALLEGAVADPGRSVADLPLLLPAELGEVLWERNATAAAYPREANLPELFAAVAGEHPDAPAIVSDGEVWSYRDLDEASNRLARHLLRLGVGPESAVGISMERSPELILGTLAILKAGGAYVPLDASYPAERLAFMLADTGAQLALAHAPTWDRVAACGARLVAVDSRATGGDWEREDARPLAVRGFRIPAESLAYVIYTSGSTGRPKGVGVPHRAIVRLVRETNYVHLGLGDRTGQVANISFDAATYEIWGALLNGAAVVVIPREVVLSPAAFAAALREQRVTSMFLTSALFTKMAREVPDAFAGMSELLVGGEAVDPAAARTVLAGSPPQRLLNGYGPTESTTFAAWHPIREVPEGAAAIPIGLPLANTTLSVLDRWQAPVPPGSVGELCIGGDGLARGYLNRPDLTAERFVPHPWPANGNLGERLYRTGDLARCPRHPDGPIELLGRVDDQVKIRGFRIEPGEIEAVLAGHPRVREQAVVAREDGSGQSRLVAYVAGLGGPAPRSEELRSWLQERLPDYMVPAAFVSLAALPLTPNGKVDRKALPAPEPGAAGEGFAAADPIDPLDPVTGLVANIWAEVLGLERVGRHDNFFALGGHSLLATQVVSRIRQVLGVELPLRELFESPTVAALAEIIRASWQEETGTATPPPPPITPITGITETPRGAGIPLSFAQQRLWLIDQLEPGNPAYNIPMAVRLTGEVTAGLLERIFAEVVRRHEVLRTLFAYREGVPVQVIIPACDWRVELPVVDLAGLPQEEREARAGALGLEEALRPFDLATGPLLRLTLVRLAGREHLLLLTLHHICSDGWSMGVLLREIAALFAAFSQGRPSPLPELPVQYADFAVWQRSWLQGEVLEAQLSSWLAQLAGAPRLLDLPTDRPRPALQTFRGGSRPLALTELSAALRELCLREGVTPFMALLAAWAAVLGRHAGQDDILVGSPIAGRNRQETEGLIGFFVNTLVLRADLSGAPAFGELLGRVRRTALDAFARQDLPFERLVEELVPERDLAVSPLVQVLFVMQNAPQGGLAVPGLLLSPMNVDSGLAKFDLTLSLTEGPAGFTGGLEHNADLFDGATAERLLARFAALLEGAVADPGRAIPDLPLLLPAELDQIRQRNATWTAYPREASLPELFAAVAREHPDAPAVITNQAAAGGEVWTYRQLDEGSNRLARRLQRLGVGPESAVGISMERSPEMILGTLAILKAGGFYVPLDPDYPDERLEFMRADVGAAVVLKDIKDIGDIKDEEDGGPLGVRVPAEALAYVIYTSGSTGRPKGVAVPHRAVVRLVRETNFVHLGPGDRIGQVASISFDAATYEIWGALLNGAAVVVIPREVVLSPAAFAAALREQRVTSMFLTASLFTRMAQEAPDAFAEMKELLVGGEAVDPAAARTVLAGSPPRCLLNGYGPTESTTFAAWHWIREVPEGAAGVPIGLPLSNTTLYVLDRWQAPVPPGSVGELCIGGDGLARGYLNRPELTAERFVPHPDGDGERLYRTGDLARSRPSEPIELLGRVDDQVKIRGFRIEPGEIEAVLAAHPAVREQAVVARRDGRGETRLVAYVAMIAAGDPAPPPEELRAWLRERLPDYMMPAGFVVLPALPLTPNGKVDRRALPAPELSDPTDPVDPIDPITELLARIFAEVLDRDRVGIRDNFFRIGGHSLLATQVVSRIRQVLGVELPLRELFDSPTVVDLAGAVRVALTEGVQ